MARNRRSVRFIRWCYRGLVTAAALAVIAGLTVAAAPSGTAASEQAASSLPCDIFASYGTPCVAAFSMDRALYADYNGPLYQVTRASDGTTDNIYPLTTGGDVNAPEQDSFCAGTTCAVTELYDQSPDGNNLTPGPGGGAAPNPDNPANATALPITVGGNEAYGLDIDTDTGYRDDGPNGDGATNVATGSEPEGMYMVASGTHVNSGCCFDFGNAETNNHDDGAGTMDAVNFGTNCFMASPACNGSGPWVAADMENGLFQQGANSDGQNQNNPNDPSNTSDFVTAILNNNGTSNFQLEGGNAQSGGLTTYWNGDLPGARTGRIPGRR